MAQKAMTQSQIVKALAEECELPNAKARQILTFLSDTAIREVKKNGLFVVPGLGRLVRVERKARMGKKSGDRRDHQDRGKEGGQVPDRKERQRRDCAAKSKEVTTNSCQRFGPVD